MKNLRAGKPGEPIIPIGDGYYYFDNRERIWVGFREMIVCWSYIQDGWGDLAFKPRLDCAYCGKKEFPFPLGRYEHEPMFLNPLFGEDLVQDEEIDEEPFPFLKLPLDVRKIVYDYFVAPFCAPSGKVNIKLWKTMDYHEKKKMHPFRNYYDMKIESALGESDSKFDRANHAHLEIEDYRALRYLSSVNRRIRTELGDAFWSHVNLDFRESNTPDRHSDMIRLFIQDRPRAAKAVRAVRWDVDIREEEEYGLDTQDMPSFKDICKIMGEGMYLQEMNVTFHANSSTMRDILMRSSKMEWIAAFRGIEVKEFEIHAFLLQSPDDAAPGSNPTQQQQQQQKAKVEAIFKMQKKLDNMLREVLLPASIASEECAPKTLYLQTRDS